MAIYIANPSELPKGAFWYVVPGKEPIICEKRDGEAFVRFTNGSRQSWVRDGECFHGPIPIPGSAN